MEASGEGQWVQPRDGRGKPPHGDPSTRSVYLFSRSATREAEGEGVLGGVGRGSGSGVVGKLRVAVEVILCGISEMPVTCFVVLFVCVMCCACCWVLLLCVVLVPCHAVCAVYRVLSLSC